MDSAIAALYLFFTTTTFEDAALLAVKLGHDADFVGVISAGMAGCRYAAEEGDGDGVLWTKSVRLWRKSLVCRDMVDKIAKNQAAVGHEYNN